MAMSAEQQKALLKNVYSKKPMESLEQVEQRLKNKKAALAFKLKSTGKGMGKLPAREESTLRRARRANLKETRSGKRVRPGLGDFTSKKKDPYANPNE